MSSKFLSDPKQILQAAIEELDLFTQADQHRLDVNENGRVIAAKESPLKRVVGLVRSHIAPLFSVKNRRKKEKKHEELKQALLNARDVIQSHSALLLKFREGDESQRKLAEYAFLAIQRYNAAISQRKPGETASYEVYSYEQQRLLSDDEIQGRPIELPRTLSIKFDSHPDSHPAHKMFKAMRQEFPAASVQKTATSLSPTHKKSLQCMIDTFYMKAIRMMQTHLSSQNSVAEIVPLVKGTPLEIDEESNPDFISMQQLLEVGPGFSMIVSGCFKRHPSDSKFLAFPMLDSFRLSFQLTHTGFPYPSQHSGWALADPWVGASPLRREKIPLFQQVDQRKKRLAERLLHEQPFIQRVRRLATLKREVFNKERELFFPLVRQLHLALGQGFGEVNRGIVDRFLKDAKEASSPYDLLVQTCQDIQELFIRKPVKALEEEWLDMASTPLRVGPPEDRFYAACERLEFYHSQVDVEANPMDARLAFLMDQGKLLGHAFHAIGLQYQSERMGFSPPLLNDFERKLQCCAFQQMIDFIEECENRLDATEPEKVKESLLEAWRRDLKILESPSIEDEPSQALDIVNELEVYFNSRFYTSHPRPFEKAS